MKISKDPFNAVENAKKTIENSRPVEFDMSENDLPAIKNAKDVLDKCCKIPPETIEHAKSIAKKLKEAKSDKARYELLDKASKNELIAIAFILKP